MKHIRAADYFRMPWKNGRGYTDQIAIEPIGANSSSDGFDWRLSAATVSEDGPFSIFEGCDRWLTVIEGNGLKLNDQMLQSGTCVRFLGEDSVSASLIDGPVIDLGLIFKRRNFDAEMEILNLSAGKTEIALAGDTHFIFCALGGVSCDSTLLQKHDALEILGNLNLSLSCTGQSRLCLVSIRRR